MTFWFNLSRHHQCAAIAPPKHKVDGKSWISTPYRIYVRGNFSKAFVVYVHPLLEYCSPVWAPVYTNDISLIEAVQRRFTKRFSDMKGLTYPQRLAKFKLETLELRRLKTDLITMFKILHIVIDIDFNEFFALSNENRTRGHRYKLLKSFNHNNARSYSFSCRRVDCWNSLPDRSVESESLDSFKINLQKLDFFK